MGSDNFFLIAITAATTAVVTAVLTVGAGALYSSIPESNAKIVSKACSLPYEERRAYLKKVDKDGEIRRAYCAHLGKDYHPVCRDGVHCRKARTDEVDEGM